MSDLLDEIRTRGYWEQSIEPGPFDPERIAYADLVRELERVAVRLRGWPLPYIDHRDGFKNGEDWVGQDIQARVVAQREAWRFFCSGQFAQVAAVSNDWETEVASLPAGDGAPIPVWEVLFTLTELVELAKRLGLRLEAQEMTIRAKLCGMANRELVVGDFSRAGFDYPRRAGADQLSATVTLPLDALVSEPRTHAAQLAQRIFQRFGWDAPLDLLTDYQRKLSDRNV